MGTHIIRMPDIGEGIAEAEIAEWFVATGETLREDDPLVAVMTDKATVEIPSPATGKLIWQAGQPGDVIAVGAELVRLEVDGPGNADRAGDAQDDGARSEPAPESDGESNAESAPEPAAGSADEAGAETPSETGSGQSASPDEAADDAPVVPMASPAVRARARQAGLELRDLPATGPRGQITMDDLQAAMDKRTEAQTETGTDQDGGGGVQEIRVIGLRSRIAQRMQAASRVPHFTIIEEVDLTALEALRRRLNDGEGPRLTPLAFIIRAATVALRDQPMLNAHFDDDKGVIRRFDAVHAGIATQTQDGLMVPVLRDAQSRDLQQIAAEIARLASAARDSSATREELTGSTVTITSLGALGALAATPVLNLPEVAIIGVNRIATRPHWTGNGFEPRQMMNLSCSFDHRVIDGWNAAVFVARLKELLEHPALIFLPEGT